ncbi:hypothetical protein ACKVEX_01455 [Rhodocyclaceae bacterium SMB388]
MQQQNPADLTALIQQARAQRDATVAALIHAGFLGAKRVIRNAVIKSRSPLAQ